MKQYSKIIFLTLLLNPQSNWCGQTQSHPYQQKADSTHQSTQQPENSVHDNFFFEASLSEELCPYCHLCFDKVFFPSHQRLCSTPHTQKNLGKKGKQPEPMNTIPPLCFSPESSRPITPEATYLSIELMLLRSHNTAATDTKNVMRSNPLLSDASLQDDEDISDTTRTKRHCNNTTPPDTPLVEE